LIIVLIIGHLGNQISIIRMLPLLILQRCDFAPGCGNEEIYSLRIKINCHGDTLLTSSAVTIYLIAGLSSVLIVSR
jgi:hypothetical protein